METNTRIKPDSKLAQKGRALLKAAHEYWEEYQKELCPGACVWLEGDNGHFILFTRSEYKESIMAAANRDTKGEERLFDPFVKE